MGEWLQTLKSRAFRRVSLDEQRAKAENGTQLRRCLGSVDVFLLGLGSTIGSGVFVVTGVAASSYAGPAVVVSYLIATAAALLSGLCYTQLVVDMPVVGGASFYMANIFGEFASWLVASNLILEYSLSVAAVGRSASGYLATLLGLESSFFTLRLGAVQLEPLSMLLILLLCGLLAHGTEASNRFNAVVTNMSIIAIAYVLCAGFPAAQPRNLVPFAPFGARGVYDAAAIVFFSFVGFDSAATVAEEVYAPQRAMPIGILGSILVSSLLYVLMSLCICLMQPAGSIDAEAPFAAAFTALITPESGHATRVFLETSSRFVSFGALTGIITSLLVCILGQARIYVLLGREGLLPSWLAVIHPARNTPANATWLTGITSGLVACLLSLDILAALVSIGTLFVFFMVACAVVWQRYAAQGAANWGLAAAVAANAASAAGLSSAYNFSAPLPLLAVLAVLWLASAALFSVFTVVYRPEKFAVPLMPATPLATMLVTLHLICSLGWGALVRFAAWSALSVVAYVIFCVRSGPDHGVEEEVQLVARASPDVS